MTASAAERHPRFAELQALQEQVYGEQRKVTRELRRRKIVRARSSLIAFAEIMKPSPEDPEDSDLSRYMAARHHKAIAAALEEVEAGRYMRVIINCPPRHGKSELSTRMLPPWFMGRDPYRNVIVGTYGDDFAEDFGREVREYMESGPYREIFPGVSLAYGSKAANRLRTSVGGNMFFVGRKGRVTGRGADLIIIDDPIKDDAEARSPAIRETVWNWFTRTISTRLMSVSGRIIIIQTRWHADDLVGRLTDPENPCYVKEEAAKWKIIDLPALAEDDDPLGRPVGEPLWPQRFTKEYLEGLRTLDPLGFSTLYQGRPTLEQGDFFKLEYFRTYTTRQLPEALRYYAASDHAVGTQQRHNFTVLLVVGIDQDDNIWLIDCFWKRAKTDEVVERMIDFMLKYPLQMWWAENGHISKSIGPFLLKRMRERKAHCAIDEVPPIADKRTRAQSIQARMSMGKVLFPAHAPWYAKAKNELLAFDGGTNDDFVDTIAHIGMGLSKQFRARKAKPVPQGIREGTLAWVKDNAEQARRRQVLVKAAGGF